MTRPIFVYNNIHLNKDDYDFFQGLPNREKLLFLYDLCLEVENLEEDLDNNDMQVTSDELLPKRMLDILDQECNNPDYVHILMLPEFLIISGNSEFAVNASKIHLYDDGYIFITPFKPINFFDSEIQELKKRFKFVKVYELLSVIYPGSLN